MQNRRQKFLKVGQKYRRDRKGKGGAMTQKEELKIGVVGYKKSSEKREQERETCVTLTNDN